MSAKTGVDDFLADGHSAADLRALIVPLTAVGLASGDRFGVHPETGAALFMPPGYLNANDRVAVQGRGGEVQVIYPGRLVVTRLLVDQKSGVEHLEVRFDAHERVVTVVAPRAELATRSGVIHHLAARGAHIHEENARQVATYLVLFAATNAKVLPRTVLTTHLGNQLDGSLVTPSQVIGGSAQYTGPYHQEVGPDPGAYRAALRELVNWPGASTAWLLLGLALAAPLVKRLRLRRNPVVSLTGDSNAGKSTATLFALGAWGKADQPPFQIEAMRTTEAGLAQSFEQGGGLPMLVDEIHTAQEPAVIEKAVYLFANGQSYSRGGREGTPQGGASLSGALIVIGEARPRFRYAGGQNRVLSINTDLHLPLGEGAEANSDEGRRRAEQLEMAFQQGAGHLGPRVISHVLSTWEPFRQRVVARTREAAYRQLKDWGPALALIVTTLEVLGELLELSLPEEVLDLPAFVSKALETSRGAQASHVEAFEPVRTLLMQADNREGELYLGNELIGWVEGGLSWLLVDSRAYQERVGPYTVQLHGVRWAKLGWITPGPDASTHSKYSRVRGKSARVLAVPPFPS